MNINIVSIIVIVIVLVILIGIKYITNSLKNIEYINEEKKRQNEEYNNVLMNDICSMLETFNELCNEIENISEERANEINQYQDEVAYRKFNTYSDEYQSYNNVLQEIILKLGESSNLDYEEIHETLTKLISRLEKLRKKLYNLEINTTYYRDSQETYGENYQAEKEQKIVSSKTFSFFSTCKTKEEAKTIYKNLVKLYHPDSPTGNKEMFEKIQEEYEKLD